MQEADKYLYKYPPDQKLCQRHRLASRIFKKFQKSQSMADCQCCKRKIGDQEKPQKSILFDPIQLSILGPGLPLFFCFLRISIYLMFMFILIYTSFCLYSNKITRNCVSNSSCQDKFVFSYSILNLQNQISSLQKQLCFMLVFSILSFFILIFLRHQLRILNEKCDFFIDSPSDYAIMIRRLPDNVTEEDIHKMVDTVKKTLTFQQRQQTLELKINRVLLSFCMKNYRQVKQRNTQKFKKSIKENKYEDFVPQKYQNFLSSGDVCIVVFQRQSSKNFFKYQPTAYQELLRCLWSPCVPLSNFQINGQKVHVERAPQPDDIIWQNANVQIQQAIKRKTKFNLLGIGLLILGCGVQLSLAIAQHQTSSQTGKTILGFISSILISLSNYGILQFLRYASSKQKNLTHTEYNSVLMVKISYLQFLNAGIFLLISKFLASPKQFSLSQNLIFQINTIMVLNGISHNLCVFILDYFQITNKIQLYLGKKGIFNHTQLEANKLFQSPLPDLPYKYGYIIKTLWLTAFYCTFAPFCAFYSIAGLVINYFVQKKLFSSTYSATQMLSSSLTWNAVKLMNCFPLSATFGGLVVFIYYSKQVTGLSFIYFMCSFIISMAIIFAPMESIAQKLFDQQKQSNLISSNYSEVQNNFQITYEMTNPAYHTKKRNKVQRMRKRIRVGDFKQIFLDMNQISNDHYRFVIQKVVAQVEQQNQKNQEVFERIDKQREQYDQQDRFLYETIARKAIIMQEQRSLLTNPSQIKRKLRQLQNYNPITSSQPQNQNKYGEGHFKNFLDDKNRIQSLIGNPFSKRRELASSLLSSTELERLQQAI